MSSETSKKKLLQELAQMIASKAGEKRCLLVDALARVFFRSFPANDLLDSKPDDVYGFIYGAYRSLERWNSPHIKVSLFTPDLEKHGWESAHSVVVILAPDMPFLLDSARGELNRRNASIHKLHGQNFSLQRDKQGQITNLEARSDAGENVSLIYFEIDRCTDTADIDDTVAALQDILAEVALVVDDFSAMRDKLVEVKAQIENTPTIDAEQREENAVFVDWLLQNHITLLGYECLGVQHSGNSIRVVDIEESWLGVLRQRRTSGVQDLQQSIGIHLAEDASQHAQLTFSKSRIRSRVHRFAYPDYIEINEFDDSGRLSLQHRFMGLYTSVVYTQSPTSIPIVRNKVSQLMHKSGLDQTNHEGRELARVIELFPRDELFHATAEELFPMARAVNQIQERRQTRLFAREVAHGKFFTCMVYMPRDRYTTATRIQIETLLRDELGAQASEFLTTFTESVLVRVYFVFLLNPDSSRNTNVSELEQTIKRLTQSWTDRLSDRLLDQYGEEQGSALFERFGEGFSAGYRDDFDPRIAVMDMGRILRVVDGEELAMSFYRTLAEAENEVHFRLFHRDTSLPLSDVIPVLENLALRVVAESAYRVNDKKGCSVWVQDFRLSYSLAERIELEKVRHDFTDAFARIWFGDAESDAFNKLLLGVRLNWREIALLRALAKYLKQIQFGFSTDYIAETLAEHQHITGAIVELFLTRFDPGFEGDQAWRDQREEAIYEGLITELEGLENLGQDRIVRQFIALIRATLRTNFFQLDTLGAQKPYFSFKLQPDLLPEMPQPVPAYEIFVYSPAVEGVHLRGGKVARGGLRWSDRHEDFRTEVLGLVKAQQVKNAVIVPVGAKGGFVAKRQLHNPSRDEWEREGIACYQTFIRGLLDVTDNIVDDAIRPPPQVVRKDADDTYLVVAADKGTATFSDIANEISSQYGHWLGDAFASGGSAGYDHKKMGITARGAWISVQRHFREMGLDIQQTDFTVVGVGDMAGDVFGNGMLLSEHIQLTAAFNHMHIFVDPNPDSTSSYGERKRLFRLPRSSWSDYDESLISQGGGIFSRNAKSIDISPQMKERFSIDAARMTPAELMHALLKSPVDLLWNGGIGTYVKATSEQHVDVGDKTNDSIRVNGSELQCKVVGEGGNLGLTQLGRVEYCLNGGRANTDFIDNAGGVDCSDHEVNIKILLNAVVARGDLTAKHRNQLLEDMTDSVAESVLRNNYHQAQAISLAEAESAKRVTEYSRLMTTLEDAGRLDRELEYLPTQEEMQDRKGQGIGLTRPELSILISYSKGILKEVLMDSELPNDSFLARAAEGAFPSQLLQDYSAEVHSHGLRREIIATQLANELINRVGVNFVDRLVSSTGCTLPEVVAAYATAAEIFQLDTQWQAVEALDHQVDSSVQMEMFIDIVRLARRASRWLLRNRRHSFDPAGLIAEFQPGVAELEAALPGLVQGDSAQRIRQRFQRMADQGVHSELAQYVAGSHYLYTSMSIVAAARDCEASNLEVAELYFTLGEELELHWFAGLITDVKVENEWQALARDSYLEDLEWQQRSLAVGALKHVCEKRDASLCIERWIEQEQILVNRWRSMLIQLHATEQPDFAMFAVANRELLDLAQSSLN